MSPYEDR